jgi:predicted nucleic acid-binding protein
MYLLGKVGGYRYQAELWKLWRAGRLALHELMPAEVNHVASLMGKYLDAPMDLADASLVAVAESRRMSRVFSLDSHFRAYRLSNDSVLELVP